MKGLREALIAAGVLAGLGACGNTGGQLIAPPFQVGGVQRDVSQPFVFTSALGWTVTLDKALAVLGPFYFNIDPPPTDAFRGGVVILQATDQVVVDCLDPTLQVIDGGADGESGVAVSVEIGLYTASSGYNDVLPLSPPLSAAGEQGTAYIAGTAVQNGTTIPFAGLAVIDGSLLTSTTFINDLARVRGAVCNLNLSNSTDVVALRVDPTHWFDQTDFCSLVPASDGGLCNPVDAGVPFSWRSSDVFNIELLGGLKDAQSVYDFELVHP